jgi:hypothetical protein
MTLDLLYRTADLPPFLDQAIETRKRLSDIFKEQLEYQRYYEQLSVIVAVDNSAGPDRTDRSRYLAAGAALVLAEQLYKQFAVLTLAQPFEDSLAQKQARMDTAMAALEGLVAYQVADVTAAATFYIAESYRNFSVALMESERPDGLTAAERVDYDLVIEEEAWPFEERAIEVHEANFEMLAAGIYNAWVQKSLNELAVMMPGRYAKNETSEDFLGSIDVFAYRMPIAPEVDFDAEGIAGTDNSQPVNDELTETTELTGLVSISR